MRSRYAVEVGGLSWVCETFWVDASERSTSKMIMLHVVEWQAFKKQKM